MDGGPGPSRGPAALRATGEEVGLATEIPVTVNEAAGPNPIGRFVAEAHRRSCGKVTLRKSLRIGTWNVQTLRQTGKLTNIIHEMKRCDIRVLGVAETHWKGTGFFTTDENELIVYSGGDCHRAGVAVFLSKEASNNMIAYQAFNERVLYVRIKASPFNVSFIQVYAPTTEAEEEEVEDFYDVVQRALRKYHSQDVIVSGDFNSKVGANSLDSDVCGKFGLGTANAAGERLISFCQENGLYITNTAFQHHNRKHYTWQSPGDRCRNQIDYILIRKRWLKCVTNSRAYPGADCGSDHNLVSATVKLRIKRDRARTNKIRLNLTELDKPTTKEAYNIQINNKFETLRLLEEERTPGELYLTVREAMMNTAECAGQGAKENQQAVDHR